MKSRSANEVTKNRSSDLVRPPVANRHVTSLPPVVIDAFDSPARAIDESARSSFETRFGRDFSRVRVHTDRSAATSAETIGAHAYTVGENIFFGANRYAPHTATGNQLLAHELAHVAQQQSSGVTTLQKFPGPLTSPDEMDAIRMSTPNFGVGKIASDLQKLTGVSEEDPRGYKGPTEVAAPEQTEVPVPEEPEKKPEKTEPEKVKVEAPPQKIPVEETQKAEKPEIEGGLKLGAGYSAGSPLKDPSLEQAGGGKIEGEVGIKDRVAFGGSISHKGVRPEGPEEAPTQVTTFSLEGKLPVGQWMFGPERIRRMGSLVALKELSLGVSFSRKQQQDEALRQIFRTRAFEYSLHLIGVTLEKEKGKLGLINFEAGLAFVGGIESEQEGPAGPTKRTTKLGGKGSAGLKFFPRGGPFFIYIDATIEVKGSKQQGGVWMGSFEFTPMGGLGINFGRLGKGKK
ncbi:MAG TPA: DUF4157 domain-containing protein [Terriglobales bacterium]|nr:DUF4157 domain-containing protein [Terriglobales bacterium]